MNHLFVAICAAACCTVSAADGYLAREFFVDSDPECICSVEPLSRAEKKAIVRSGFAVSGSPEGPFSVISVEPHRLRLRDVDIHVYACDDGSYVVSVTSILGNHGQNQFSSFYEVDGSGEILGEVGPGLLGITEVRSNEFLEEQDRFPEESDFPVQLYIQDDGSFLAEPWTWMNPDWLDREIVNRILFVWTGEGFEKVVSRLTG